MRASKAGPFLAALGTMVWPAPVVAQTAQVTPSHAEASSASAGGRELVWANSEVGVTHVDVAFPDDREPWTVTETGVVAGAGLGVRLAFFTVGFRFHDAPLHTFNIWTLGPEAGIHAPFGALDSYLALGAGYLSFGPGNGLDMRLSVGVDYHLTKLFSLGVNVGGDRLVVIRPGTRNATGGAVTAAAVAGLHF